jgi:RNA-directed DNA polymerase
MTAVLSAAHCKDTTCPSIQDHLATAQRVAEVIPKRFGKYGLTVHPTKTRLIPFRSPSQRTGDPGEPAERPGTFNVLGFTHYWGRSRRGDWIIKLKTASDRFGRAVRSIDSWCRVHRHWSLREQQQKLSEKLRGHYAYYGVTGNSRALARFQDEVEIRWWKWLRRRNRRRSLNWSVFHRLLRRYPLAPAGSVRSIYRRAAT